MFIWSTTGLVRIIWLCNVHSIPQRWWPNMDIDQPTRFRLLRTWKELLRPLNRFHGLLPNLITKHAGLALFTGIGRIWHNALGKTMPTMDSDVPRVGNLLFISYFYSVVTFCRYKFSYCWLRWIICYLTYIK